MQVIFYLPLHLSILLIVFSFNKRIDENISKHEKNKNTCNTLLKIIRIDPNKKDRSFLY